MARNDHQRASVSTPINNFLYFFAYFICGVELPALWMKVTEAIYNLRESHNCPLPFDKYFRFAGNASRFCCFLIAFSMQPLTIVKHTLFWFNANKRGNSLGDRLHEIIFGQVNNQLKVNKQLNSSTILNFHSKHLCFGHYQH